MNAANDDSESGFGDRINAALDNFLYNDAGYTLSGGEVLLSYDPIISSESGHEFRLVLSQSNSGMQVGILLVVGRSLSKGEPVLPNVIYLDIPSESSQGVIENMIRGSLERFFHEEAEE